MMVNDSNSSIVSVEGLHKRYGDLVALRGITLEIKAGEVFGLLGPNGAGKTTTIEILEGLRQPDSGTVRVCGMDPGQEQAALKERIGAQLQATVLPDKIRVEEALTLFASFYREPASINCCWNGLAWGKSGRRFLKSFPAARSNAWPWRWPW